MTPREELLDHIEKLKQASRKSHSEYIKIDYAKAIRKMKKELKTYDMYQRQTSGEKA